MTYNRLESDDVDNVMADLAQHIGYSFRLKIDQDLLGDMANFTGGSVGSGRRHDHMGHDLQRSRYR
jgi:hypothetical protein